LSNRFEYNEEGMISEKLSGSWSWWLWPRCSG